MFNLQAYRVGAKQRISDIEERIARQELLVTQLRARNHACLELTACIATSWQILKQLRRELYWFQGVEN